MLCFYLNIFCLQFVWILVSLFHVGFCLSLFVLGFVLFFSFFFFSFLFVLVCLFTSFLNISCYSKRNNQRKQKTFVSDQGSKLQSRNENFPTAKKTVEPVLSAKKPLTVVTTNWIDNKHSSHVNNRIGRSLARTIRVTLCTITITLFLSNISAKNFNFLARFSISFLSSPSPFYLLHLFFYLCLH